MLSIIIPSYKDPLLHKTIDSLLENAEGDIEIIPVIDGYDLRKPLSNDARIKPVWHICNQGMRESINDGVDMAWGEFIMRVDEHSKFDKGYDIKLTEEFKDNWIVKPRRYKLDPYKWEVMPNKAMDHEKLVIHKPRMKFASCAWRERDKTYLELISEDMAMQGSCWVMKRSWWDKVIKRLQTEGYGTHYQDSIEMVFKTWKAGGKLMLNRKTWHAHKHRKFNRTHNFKRKWSNASFKYALSIWGDYYRDVIKPRWGI